jgi:hypothetical protein
MVTGDSGTASGRHDPDVTLLTLTGQVDLEALPHYECYSGYADAELGSDLVSAPNRLKLAALSHTRWMNM